MQIKVLYFAQLGEEAAKAEELLDTTADTLAAVYAQLRERYGFSLAQNHLRVARNQAFADWQDGLAEGDEIAFIPPVSGG